VKYLNVFLYSFLSTSTVRLATLALACFALHVTPAVADDFNDLDDLTLEELMSINVSVGTLFDENELDIANTVELITKEQWQDRGAKNYLDAIGYLPSILPLQNPWGSTVAVRGFATVLSIRGIGNLVDGVAVNSLAEMSSGYNETMQILGLLDRVEVLRGPGSALYGSDAFHAVFSLKTFKSDKDVVIARAEAGDLGVHDVSIKISQALGENWRINTAFAMQGQGDQSVEFEYTDFRLPSDSPMFGDLFYAERKNTVNQWGTVISLEGEVTSKLKTEISYYGTGRDLEGAIGGGRGPAYGDGLSFGLDKDFSDAEGAFDMTRIRVTYRFDDQLGLTMQGYHWVQEEVRVNDVSYVTSEDDFYYPNPHPLLVNKINEVEKLETSHGVDVTFKRKALKGETQWLLQLQHKRGGIDEYESIFIDKTTGATAFTWNFLSNGYRREINSIAFQGKTPILDNKVFLIYGGRADYYSDLGEQLTPKAGVIYRPYVNQSFRFNYGQSFRAPSTNELLGIEISETALKPETIDTYELSFLHISKKHRYSVTLFNSQWLNAIDVVSDSYVIKNRSSSGVELSLKGVKDSFSYEVNGAYAHTRYDDAEDDTGAFPETAINAIGSYYWHQYDIEFTSSNRLKFEMKEGPVSSADEDPDTLPVYFRMDLNVAHHINDDAFVWISFRNLLDRENVLPSLWNAEGGYQAEAFAVALGGSYSF